MKITFKTIITFLSVLVLYFIPTFIFKTDQDFYDSLIKIPVPSFVFSISWSIIFVIMALFVTFLITTYNAERKRNYQRLAIYIIINYLLIAAFTPVFFGAHNLFGGFVISILTFATVVFIIMEAFVIDKRTFWLLFFYLLWSVFATINSAYIYLQN